MAVLRTALHGRLLQALPFSFGSLRLASSFKAADLVIERNAACKQKPDPSTLVFGKQFSDHMLTINWSEKDGWQAPQIKPFQNLSLHPASSALHYSIELFEGMKAFRGVDNHVRLFRPMLNMERMHRSAERSCLPVIPLSSNYGPTIAVQSEAVKRGCQQVLWLYGEQEEITEVGTMNLFIYWTNENGEKELFTPPLDGIILPGVTRQSLLDLSRSWGEFKVTERTMGMPELLGALDSGRVLEVFGAGTACVVCPVGSLLYRGTTYQVPTIQNGLAKRFHKELTDIQYGRKSSEWAPVVV
ncbi:branched-chain-amino-acid aminotransferase, mitochondrial [Notothenia coriiceps]|uniref:Branched-chain-amino-acid aminotransferase n=1 Tax=Notothenia coriiceps TaxID=8208 RepID=A0A6I9NPY2_9TELE|nr:PREDICTED: branched-chain-amino-acid aminotransferase, cytosolic [Notothenia coriiceps]